MYGTSSPAQLGTPTAIFWNVRLDSNQRPRVFNRISLHAIKLCRLRYARICSACRLDCHASCALEAPQAFQAATHWLSQGGRIPTEVFSGHCHFHVSHDERSHIVRVLPGLWHKRQVSNLHIWESKSHALPFGYACIKADTREISRECLHAGNALARPLVRRHPLPAVP